jgi:hypothetical protein
MTLVGYIEQQSEEPLVSLTQPAEASILPLVPSYDAVVSSLLSFREYSQLHFVSVIVSVFALSYEAYNIKQDINR